MYNLRPTIQTDHIRQILARLADTSIVWYTYRGPKRRVGQYVLNRSDEVGIDYVGNMIVGNDKFKPAAEVFSDIRQHLVRKK